MRNDDPINSHTRINIRKKNNKRSLCWKENLHSDVANISETTFSVQFYLPGSLRLTLDWNQSCVRLCQERTGRHHLRSIVQVTTQQTLTKKRIQWAMNVSQVKYSKLATSIGNTAIQHMLLSWSQHPEKRTILTCQKRILRNGSVIFVLLMLSFTPEPLSVKLSNERSWCSLGPTASVGSPPLEQKQTAHIKPQTAQGLFAGRGGKCVKLCFSGSWLYTEHVLGISSVDAFLFPWDTEEGVKVRGDRVKTSGFEFPPAQDPQCAWNSHWSLLQCMFSFR